MLNFSPLLVFILCLLTQLQACLGAAVIAMGPEKVLSLVPISFDTEKEACSNKWMLPILKKYVTGSSLQYFMDHIVPLAESVQNACRKGICMSCLLNYLYLEDKYLIFSFFLQLRNHPS